VESEGKVSEKKITFSGEEELPVYFSPENNCFLC
jgi:hypothetical protein